jgi:hypothetical protein
MPVPLAPLLPLALRLGAVAAAGVAARRWIAARSHAGRTDQRAEDALDDLAEGLALHRPAEPARAGQSNAALRLRRVLRWPGGGGVEIDAAVIGRFRIRRT